LPVTKAPESWLVHTPGKNRKLMYLAPHDYWHVVPDAPAGYWVEHFQIAIIREPKQALAHLPKALDRCAIIGERHRGARRGNPNNPNAVVNYLHYHRAFKTDYELAMMRCRVQARRAHAPRRRSRIPCRRLRIRHQYGLSRRRTETENELPYSNIIALIRHAPCCTIRVRAHHRHMRSRS